MSEDTIPYETVQPPERPKIVRKQIPPHVKAALSLEVFPVRGDLQERLTEDHIAVIDELANRHGIPYMSVRNFLLKLGYTIPSKHSEEYRQAMRQKREQESGVVEDPLEQIQRDIAWIKAAIAKLIPPEQN